MKKFWTLCSVCLSVCVVLFLITLKKYLPWFSALYLTKVLNIPNPLSNVDFPNFNAFEIPFKSKSSKTKIS